MWPQDEQLNRVLVLNPFSHSPEFPSMHFINPKLSKKNHQGISKVMGGHLYNVFLYFGNYNGIGGPLENQRPIINLKGSLS